MLNSILTTDINLVGAVKVRMPVLDHHPLKMEPAVPNAMGDLLLHREHPLLHSLRRQQQSRE